MVSVINARRCHPPQPTSHPPTRLLCSQDQDTVTWSSGRWKALQLIFSTCHLTLYFSPNIRSPSIQHIQQMAHGSRVEIYCSPASRKRCRRHQENNAVWRNGLWPHLASSVARFTKHNETCLKIKSSACSTGKTTPASIAPIGCTLPQHTVSIY